MKFHLRSRSFKNNNNITIKKRKRYKFLPKVVYQLAINQKQYLMRFFIYIIFPSMYYSYVSGSLRFLFKTFFKNSTFFEEGDTFFSRFWFCPVKNSSCIYYNPQLPLSEIRRKNMLKDCFCIGQKFFSSLLAKIRHFCSKNPYQPFSKIKKLVIKLIFRSR